MIARSLVRRPGRCATKPHKRTDVLMDGLDAGGKLSHH